MAQAEKGDSIIYLKGGLLLDGTGRAPVPNAGVVWQDGIILAVGTAEALTQYDRPGIRVLNVGGKVIMPGMIDCHVHHVYSGHTNPYMLEMRDSIEMGTVRAIRNARVLLDTGFTTVRDNGCRGNVAVTLRQAIDEGLIVGPRIVAGVG